MPGMCAILFCFISTVWAAGVDSVVGVRILAPTEPVAPGVQVLLAIELGIARNYHINSNAPLQDYLIPASVDFDPFPGVTFDEAVFPQAQVKKLPVSDTPMSVYERAVTITVVMRLEENFSQREVLAQGRVRSQACDRYSCLPPVWTPFSVIVPVDAVTRTPETQTDVPKSGFMLSESRGEIGIDASVADFYRRGLLLNLLPVFLGGLALNLTPCVYPVIPITLAWFGGQTRGNRAGVIMHACVYVFGMAVTYSILGAIAAVAGGFFGAVLQYPAALAGVALVLMLLALVMFDVFEARLPAFIATSAGIRRAGPVGTLLMGLTVGVVAAPCIGPFVLGLLTYVGELGNAVAGFMLFFALALGLGAPYLFLAIFSGSIHRLPRSGAWMAWVRKIFGFVLLCMAWYYLRSLIFPLTWSLGLAFLLLMSGIYLAWIASVPGTGKIFTVFRNLVGCIFFASALYATVNGVETALNEKIAASFTKEPASVFWESYSKESIARARDEHRPVFIDFYADWCQPCRELETKTYSDPEVISLARRFVMLKADLTAADDPAVKTLMERYRVRGVPTLVFLRPDGAEMTSLRGTGFEPAGIFLDKMIRAIRASEPSE